MPTCLGLYIENNLIKYAKVSRDKNTIKVDAFGIKVYDNIGAAISQIVEETFSFKTPISINLSDEMYNYFNMFALLNKKDMYKAIQTSFESYCFDKGYNKNVFENRYVLTANPGENEQVKAIYVSANKTEITGKIQQFEGKHLTTITPLPMAITNLIDLKEKENCIIVNIEEKTTLTTILGDKVYHIDTFEEGMGDILNKINLKENSYTRAYEICKNTTIYTTAAKDLQIDDDNESLEEIMPTLYNILEHVKQNLTTSLNKIDKIYLTGTAAIINNVDLYFQENLSKVKCEILKPYFIDKATLTKLNVKDYIEVNSAIALGLQGLGLGIKEMNFKKESLLDKLNVEINFGKSSNKKPTKEGRKSIDIASLLHFTNDLGQPLDKVEKNMLRGVGGIAAVLIIFILFSGFMNSGMKKKMKQADMVISDTNSKIAQIDSTKTSLDTVKDSYHGLNQKIQQLVDKEDDKSKRKDAIPNFLNQIMFIMPKNAQLTSIENTSDKHIKINAQSEKYEQLGYLVAKIKADGILNNVTSDSGVKEGNIIKITIEGDLP